MSEYVWSVANLFVADGRFTARLEPGQVWWADDPLVQARPGFFSATPLQVQSTTRRPAPGPTPVVAKAPELAEPKAAEPPVEESEGSETARRRTRRG